jgi:hypothetical protein
MDTEQDLAHIQRAGATETEFDVFKYHASICQQKSLSLPCCCKGLEQTSISLLSSVAYSRMDAIGQVYTKVRSEYSKNATKKLMMVDGLACYCVITGIVQVLSSRFLFRSLLPLPMDCLRYFSSCI